MEIVMQALNHGVIMTACECTAGIPEAKADWFGYYMAQMSQTYRTRKVMYDDNRMSRP